MRWRTVPDTKLSQFWDKSHINYTKLALNQGISVLWNDQKTEMTLASDWCCSTCDTSWRIHLHWLADQNADYASAASTLGWKQPAWLHKQFLHDREGHGGTVTRKANPTECMLRAPYGKSNRGCVLRARSQVNAMDFESLHISRHYRAYDMGNLGHQLAKNLWM